MPSPILRQVDVPVAFTLLGLLFACATLVASIHGHFPLAVLLLMAAGTVDLFDGSVARMVSGDGTRTAMSSKLDAIVDLVSFGIAPAAFAYCLGLRGPVELVILALYVLANALRLAYYSSTPPVFEAGRKLTVGLPVTFAALFIPWAYLATYALPMETFKQLLAGVYLALAVAMVAGFRIPKPAGLWYGFYTAVGLVPAFVIGAFMVVRTP